MITNLFKPTHLLLILIVVLILFGPSKLPQIGSTLGKTIRDFKNSINMTSEDEAGSENKPVSTSAETK